MREDAARTAAIRRGDADTLEAIARDVIPGLLRAARAAGLTPDRAEDAVQEALLVFVRRAPEFDGRARVTSWIYGMLIHKISEERRHAGREQAHDEIDTTMESRFDPNGRWSRPPTGPAALAASEVRRHLGDCLQDVPDRQRLAFTLRDVEGFETDEVCKILDISANNVGVLLFRARNRLRECLESKGVEGSDDARV